MTVESDDSIRISAGTTLTAIGATNVLTQSSFDEQRLLDVINRSDGGAGTQVSCIDRTNAGGLNAVVDLPGGDALMMYTWGSAGSYSSPPADYIFLARGTPGPCLPGVAG